MSTAGTASTSVASPSGWSYDSGTDGIRKGQWKTATLDSVESLAFDFPYNRPSNHGHLVFRIQPSDGKRAYLTMDKGQFLCGYSGCSVTVRFDDGPVRRIGATSAQAGQADTIFLNYQALLPSVRKAKTMILEADFYREGARQMTFNVEGLNWQ